MTVPRDEISDSVWRGHAANLAGRLAHPASRWIRPIATVSRHELIPRWFESRAGQRRLRIGVDDPEAWMHAAYVSPRSLVTQVGALHADCADADARPTGSPASSGTNPYLVMQMLRYARVHTGATVLDIGTGPGYSAALLAARLGEAHVTSIDVDTYITDVATRRLARIGLHPAIATVDARGRLDWEGDRIVATVAMPGIPASWLSALRTGGRLAVTVQGTSILITARKLDDGFAWGVVEPVRVGFMPARGDVPETARAVGVPDVVDGGEKTVGRMPVIDLTAAAALSSMLALTAPGVEHRYAETDDAQRTAWITHPDGSWAKATGRRGEAAEVRQDGPRRLWDLLESIRTDWLADGRLPLDGAEVRIDPDGTCHLASGAWSATLPPLG